MRQRDPLSLEKAFEREAWKHGRLFPGGMGRQSPISFHEYVHAPYPAGLGTDFDTVRRFLGQDPRYWRCSTGRASANDPSDRIHCGNPRPAPDASSIAQAPATTSIRIDVFHHYPSGPGERQPKDVHVLDHAVGRKERHPIARKLLDERGNSHAAAR